MDLRYAVDFTKKLMSIHSPTGYTHEAMNFLQKEFERLGIPVTKTVKGAVYGTIEGKNTDKSRVITAHVDTLGAMVREIKSNGWLKLINIGGFPFNNIEGENIYVITREGKLISGVGLPDKASVHVFDSIGKNERTLDSFEMRLDIETSSKEETLAAGINVGDFVVFDPRTVETETGFLKSRFLDDKACVAMLFDVCRELKEKNEKPAYTTHFFIGDYEEIGHGMYAAPEDTFELLAIDIGTVGGGQTSDEHAVTIMAKDRSTPYDYILRKKLEDLAIENKLNYKTDVMHNYGSDASSYIKAGRDMRFGCMGPGVHATHHYERTHLDSFENTIKLLYAYVLAE
ncbi:MAG: peptidase M42 [Treponema sp.]|nr:MAG: peptidase M42 [Treponema sp.]